MEQGHAGDYTGNNGKLIHKHYMENAVHDFETGHAVAGKYEAGRASAFENSTDYLTGGATSLAKQKQGTGQNTGIFAEGVPDKDIKIGRGIFGGIVGPSQGIGETYGGSRYSGFDADNDGDHMFNDSNNDGTMLSRGFNKLTGRSSVAQQNGVSDPDTNNMPITGLDQTLDNSAIAKNDAMLMQENGYGMGAAKMSVLKNRYSTMVHQTQGQTDTFGINGTDPNAGLYKGIVDEANS